MLQIQKVIFDPLVLVLLGASLLSWWIIIDRWLLLTMVIRADKATYKGHPGASPLARLRGEMTKLAGVSREDLLLALDASIALERHRLERSMALLGAIGGTAPYVGLLGTVFGIIRAFMDIQVAKNMDPSVVAGGIALALIATAAGLAVAIPAVVAHHLLTAAVNRHVATWEIVLTRWMTEPKKEAEADEPVPVA